MKSSLVNHHSHLGFIRMGSGLVAPCGADSIGSTARISSFRVHLLSKILLGGRAPAAPGAGSEVTVSLGCIRRGTCQEVAA